MIMYGTNIISTSDPLQKMNFEFLINSIKNPKPILLNQIQNLRIIKNIDIKQYQSLKRQLPFIVCAHFNPPIRKKENFAYTEYFIVDIDHLSYKNISTQKLKNEIIKDERVLICFESPGQDGLKIIFRLKERCFDSGIYSIFYKKFIDQFAIQYNLEQIVDTKTSDVSRACFLSYDESIYYNPNSTTVILEQFIDYNNPDSLFKIQNEIKESEKESKKDPNYDTNKSDSLSQDVLVKIKTILQSEKQKLKENNNIYVPEQINEVTTELHHYIEMQGVTVYDIQNIQYGKKFRMRVGLKEAEINIFYGKKGFSVVISPRNGTNSEMNQIMADLIKSFFSINDSCTI